MNQLHELTLSTYFYCIFIRFAYAAHDRWTRYDYYDIHMWKIIPNAAFLFLALIVKLLLRF